jgi:hypothetical protein
MNKVSADKSKDLRKMMIENIKNTDMSVHFKLMAEFKERFEADENFGISEGEIILEILTLKILRFSRRTRF